MVSCMKSRSRNRKADRGAPRKHGPSFKLNSAHRTADREETFQLGEQTVRVQAWQKLHFKKLAAFVGTLVQIEFFKADRSARVINDQCGYGGPDRRAWRFPIFAACIFGDSQSSISSDFSNSTWDSIPMHRPIW